MLAHIQVGPTEPLLMTDTCPMSFHRLKLRERDIICGREEEREGGREGGRERGRGSICMKLRAKNQGAHIFLH